jgi:hypothetical protein
VGHPALLEENCAIARSSEIAGERWVRVIPRQVFNAARRPRVAEPLPGSDRCGGGVSGRGERALPSVVIPAGWVIEEVQVDDLTFVLWSVKSAEVF